MYNAKVIPTKATQKESFGEKAVFASKYRVVFSKNTRKKIKFWSCERETCTSIF